MSTARTSQPPCDVPQVPARPARAPGLVPLPGGPLQVWDQAVLRGAGFALDRVLRTVDPVAAGEVDDAFAALAQVPQADRAGRARAQARLDQASAALLAFEHRSLRAVAAEPDFQTAVAWQNTAVLLDAVRPLAELPAGVNRKQSVRRKERAVARYLARYAAKNDTIGFTGPVCWGEVRDQGPAIDVRMGSGLIDRRSVFLEPWAVDVLAELLASDPRLRRVLAPRAHPATFRAGGWVLRTDGPPYSLRPDELLLLDQVDGVTPAAHLADGLVVAHPDRFATPQDVLATIEHLVTAGVLRWDLEPELRQHPDRALRCRLQDARALDPVAVDEALALLATLERGRDTVAQAGDVDDLIRSLAELGARFTELTGRHGYHGHGTTYAGRQLVYLDTRRDLRFGVGGEVLHRLGPPLGVLCYSLRSLASRTAELYEDTFRTTAQGLSWLNGGGPVPVAHLMAACGPVIGVPGERLCDLATEEFVRHWEELLALDTDAPQVQLSSAELWPRIRQRFPVARRPWAQAHLHGADVQIGARDVESLARGQFRLVLGELHAFFSTIECAVMAGQHDDPARLVRTMDASLPTARMMLVPNKGYPRVLARTTPSLGTGRDWWLSLNAFPGGEPARRTSLAELLVDVADDGLFARTPDGRLRMRLLDVLGLLLAADLVDVLKLVGTGRRHVPRVSIDDLVVLRRSWSLPVTELLALTGKDEVTTFARVRRRAAELGLPRWVFASVPGEPKPFLVDLAAAVQVAVLATTVRACAARDPDAGMVRLTEMLPAPDETCLPTPDGGTCTSELRLQLVDPGEGW